MSVQVVRRFLSDGFGSFSDGLGVLALVAAVSLAWPGVQVARAEETALMSVDPVLVQAQAARPTAPAKPAQAREPASCSNPGVPSTLNDAMVAHQIRRAMRDYAQRVQAEGPQDPSEGIVLNGSGYNYKPMRLEER